jgi:hypothetical protein
LTGYHLPTVRRYFRQGDSATTNTAKGEALECLVRYLFRKIPGVYIAETNEEGAFGNDEFDILIWNARESPLYFLPTSFIIECKNSDTPVGSREIGAFRDLLRSRACDHGILVACAGISGGNSPPTDAYAKISEALHDFVNILVITRRDIETLNSTEDMVKLLQKRLGGLKRTGTCAL